MKFQKRKPTEPYPANNNGSRCQSPSPQNTNSIQISIQNTGDNMLR